MMVKVSVIMPIFNVEDYLERSITSIIEQTFTQWELLLINDGSTDSSQKICEKYESWDSRIKLFNQSNQGSGVARQKGLDNANGLYICFVDPDDYLDTMALEKNYELMIKYDVDVVQNGYFELVNNFNRVEIRKHSPIITGFFDKQNFIKNFGKYEKVGSKSLWNKLYKFSLLKEHNIKFTNQRVGQDALFNFEVYSRLRSIFISNNHFYYYDNTRSGSAIKSYRDERYNYEINIAQRYEKLFRDWGVEEIYYTTIQRAYWNAISAEVINIAKKDSPYKTKKDKILQLKTFRNNNFVNNKVSSIFVNELNTKFHKLLFIIFKSKKYLLTMILSDLFVKVRF